MPALDKSRIAYRHNGHTVRLAAPRATPPPYSSVNPYTSPGDVKRAFIGADSFPITGVNRPRSTNSLIVYTRTASTTTSPANPYGVEAIVDSDGYIVGLSMDRQVSGDPPPTIPVDGYLLSGHGEVAPAGGKWLIDYAKVGRRVSLASA